MSTTSPAGMTQVMPTPEVPSAVGDGRTRRVRTSRGGDRLTAYLMIAPMAILLGIFVFWPLAYSFYLSTFKINFYLPSKFVGLQFYRDVLGSDEFWHSIMVGLYYSLLTIPTGIVLALLLASFIKTLSKRAAAFMKTTVYLPAVVSTVIASLIFVFMYQDQGVVNWLVGLINLGPVSWLNDPHVALPAIAVPGLWLGFGITTLILLAGMLDIPDSYYESAALDGANFFQRTWFVTLPLLKNVLLYLLVTGFTLALQMIDLPLVMTNGGPVDATSTPNFYIFDTFRDVTPYATSFALTASLLLFAVIGLISVAMFRLINSTKAIDG